MSLRNWLPCLRRAILVTWLLVSVTLFPLADESVTQLEAKPYPLTAASVVRNWRFDTIAGQWLPVGPARGPIRSVTISSDLPCLDSLPISTAGGIQLDPAVTWNPDRDEFLVVWQDGRNGTDLDIYAQRIAPDGRLLGDNFALVVAEFDQWAPWVVYRPAVRGYWLVWHHRQRNSHRVYLQALSPSGSPLGHAMPVTTGNDCQQWVPACGYDPVADELLVTWEDMDTSAIAGQRIGGDGASRGHNIIISAQPSSQWAPPVVAYNPMLQEFIVVWDDFTNQTVSAQIVERDGSLRGPNSVITRHDNALVSGVVSGGIDAGYWAFWTQEDNNPGQGSDIWGQKLTADGLIINDALGIAVEPGSQRDCVAVYDAQQSECVLAWWDGDPETGSSSIKLQHLSWAGAFLGSRHLVSATGLSETAPQLGFSQSHDSYLIAWHTWLDDPSQTNEADIYGQLYSPQRYHAFVPLCLLAP